MLKFVRALAPYRTRDDAGRVQIWKSAFAQVSFRYPHVHQLVLMLGSSRPDTFTELHTLALEAVAADKLGAPVLAEGFGCCFRKLKDLLKHHKTKGTEASKLLKGLERPCTRAEILNPRAVQRPLRSRGKGGLRD